MDSKDYVNCPCEQRYGIGDIVLELQLLEFSVLLSRINQSHIAIIMAGSCYAIAIIKQEEE